MKELKKIFLAVIYFLINFWEIFADAKISLIPEWKNALAEAFRTWEFSFDLIWQYILFLINIFSQIAVMVSFLFVLIWAFRYTITYLEWDENWDNAKKTIKNALIWLAISTLAYVIVDIFVRFLL